MKTDEVDFLAPAVFGDLEQIKNSKEPGLSRQFRRDIGEADLLNRVHFNLAFFHAVSAADAYAGLRPYPDAARDLPAPNPVPKAFGEHHVENVLRHSLNRMPWFKSRNAGGQTVLQFRRGRSKRSK